MNFIIPLHIYPFDVMVSIGQTDVELNKVLKRYSIELDADEAKTFNSKRVEARTLITEDNQTIIRLKRTPKTPHDKGILAHEIFHAVTFILDRVGMKLQNMVSDEAYAYLTGFLTTEIYKRLNDPIPTK